MNENNREKFAHFYRVYLLFMIVACGGACLWQFLTPQIAGLYSIWGTAVGWQREIALWNVAFIITVLLSLKKNNVSMLRMVTFQSTILCWLLGFNHFVAFVHSNFSFGSIHFLGLFEVMLCGGIWGSILLFKYRSNN